MAYNLPTVAQPLPMRLAHSNALCHRYFSSPTKSTLLAVIVAAMVAVSIAIKNFYRLWHIPARTPLISVPKKDHDTEYKRA
jgi:hypothetical protein